jgi:uncharacterized membrane protein
VVAINPSEPIIKTDPANKIRFRWIYIILPAAFLLLSLVLAAFFYHLLPAQIAYHLHGDTPDRWMSRGVFISWMLIPQFLFTLLAFATVRIVLLGARYWPADSTPLRGLLPVMGNMLALPQIILFVAMLQFFLYNAYHTKPIPLWIVALIILLLGGIVLAVFFIRTIRQFRSRHGKILRE